MPTEHSMDFPFCFESNGYFNHLHDKMYCLPYVTKVVEVVTANVVMGDSANVDDVVPVGMVDNVVPEAERR